MSLIDKETIRKEIERRTYNAHEMPDSRPDKQFYEGKDVAYGEILAFLDTLKETPTWVSRAEQRQKDQADGKKIAIMEIRAEIERLKEKAAERISKAQSRHFGSYDYERVVNSRGELSALYELGAFLDTLPEQPASEDLEKDFEKEIDKTVNECTNGYDFDWEKFARHFYELGCTRTAEMYDDVEYNRQRAEEAELSGDLEEEIGRFIDAVDQRTGGRWSEEDILECARHFAEWGAEQKVIEIFKKQNCRGCGTQRCTGEDEWLEGCREFQKWRAAYLKK